MSPAPNQISAADASLAVTALKIAVPIPTLPTSPICRRRTISACKLEDDDTEVLLYDLNSRALKRFTILYID
jgi:hypothetical protein